MIHFHAIGDWSEPDLACQWTPSTFNPDARVLALIDSAWASASDRPGVHLFDGRMCRLESFTTGPTLSLCISETSYRAFLGTNMANPGLADELGPTALANPIGQSAALVSADNQLLLGMRSDRVWYYPRRLHPFSGSLEPADAARPFDGIRRELREELSLSPRGISGIHCLAIAEDHALRHPELIFMVRSPLRSSQIKARLDLLEHHTLHAFSPADLDSLLNDPRPTPIALAAALLWGRQLFGEDWFRQRAQARII